MVLIILVGRMKINRMIYRHIIIFIFIFGYLCATQTIYAQNIITIAGTGTNTNDGDDGPATCAGIPNPSGLVADGKGFLYIALTNSIRKIDLARNTISRVAGSDTYGFAGDGGPAKAALLQFPYALCLDKKNNLYVSEMDGHRIRKIDLTTGIISTIAGLSTAGFSGDGGPAINASFNTPLGICTDAADNIYIADNLNHRVRRIDAVTGIITTVAGNGTATFSGDGGAAINAGIARPNCVAVDPSGNIFLTESFPTVTARIRKINTSTGTISTVAGSNVSSYSGDGGPAINANLYNPISLCFDPAGNLYVAENDDSRIRVINSAGIINNFAGNGTNGFGGDGGPATVGSLHFLRQITHDGNGNLFACDLFNNRIRAIGANSLPPAAIPTAITGISADKEIACEGQPVTFTASVVNPGFNAIYQWKVNGNPVNIIQPVFTTSILKEGDLVSLTLLSVVCGQNLAINSNTLILMHIKPRPQVSVTTFSSEICAGQMVNFTAVANNAGNNPVYQWRLNSTNVGTNSNSFSSSSLTQNDTVYCLVTGNGSVTCTDPVPSNKVIISVNAGLSPTINIKPSANDICKGSPVTFTASTTNANIPVYQWILNGKNVGTNSISFTSSTLEENDVITCRLTTSGPACASSTVISPEVKMHIKQSPVISLYPKDTLVAPGTQVKLNANIVGQYTSYTWSPSAMLTSSATLQPTTVALNDNVEYSLNVVGDGGCNSKAVAILRIYRKLYMPNAFTPNGDNVNDIYRIPPGSYINLYEFSIYDRFGQKVFTTTDITKGWDGTLKGLQSPIGSYTYLIRGADDKSSITEKGTVTLIR